MTAKNLNALRKGLMTAGALVVMTSFAYGDDAAKQFQMDFLDGKATWDDVKARAKEEGKMNFYYWGGSDTINVWVDSVVIPALAGRPSMLRAGSVNTRGLAKPGTKSASS